MDRMKQFLKWLLWLIGFFIISVLLENGLLMSMYSHISGEFNGYYDVTNSHFSIENVSGKACNINGYLNFDLINSTENYINKCYVKVDLFNEENLLADTEYFEILEMQPNDIKSFAIKFKANHIKKFYISIVENTPDKTNIINILGWETDVTNVFGLGIDLSNVSLFGVKLTDLFSAQNAKTAVKNGWDIIKAFLKSIPWWGYAIGGGIVAWYLPPFYLFGIL